MAVLLFTKPVGCYACVPTVQAAPSGRGRATLPLPLGAAKGYEEDKTVPTQNMIGPIVSRFAYAAGRSASSDGSFVSGVRPREEELRRPSFRRGSCGCWTPWATLGSDTGGSTARRDWPGGGRAVAGGRKPHRRARRGAALPLRGQSGGGHGQATGGGRRRAHRDIVLTRSAAAALRARGPG